MGNNRHRNSRRLVHFAAASWLTISASLLLGTTAYAEEAKPSATLQQLQALIEQHRLQIEAQEEAIAQQRRRLQALEEQIYATGQAPHVQPVVYQPLAGLSRSGLSGGAAQGNGQYVAQDQSGEVAQSSGAASGGGGEEQNRPPEIVVLSDRGGVLTPKGTIIIEPSLDYSKSTSNRLNFRGISIVDGFLIGVIEASDADRDTITSQLTARYGVTNRLEVSVSVPFVYRSDRTTSLVGGAGGTSVTTDTSGDGLGDIEVAAHYQINDGMNDWPFFIANLRYKSTSGTGPFDIGRDSDGVPTELATGSGFHAIEPSLTVIYPTDPAVLFANIGYLVNLPSDVNSTVGSALIGDVDPGDSIGISFGVGFALNEKLSLNLGYQHDFVFETVTETDGVDVNSETLSVGSFLFGGSYRLSDMVSLNLTVQMGATEDAPDSRIIFRVPVRFNVL